MSTDSSRSGFEGQFENQLTIAAQLQICPRQSSMLRQSVGQDFHAKHKRIGARDVELRS